MHVLVGYPVAGVIGSGKAETPKLALGGKARERERSAATAPESGMRMAFRTTITLSISTMYVRQSFDPLNATVTTTASRQTPERLDAIWMVNGRRSKSGSRGYRRLPWASW